MCKISVIMSTYNEPATYIHEAVRSILSQSFRDFEYIIVLDNPENSEIEAIVRSYAKQDARIRVIKNEDNRGLVASLNRALSVATGDYVARMDADDISLPLRLEKELQCLEQNDLDVVGALIRRISEEGELLPGTETRYYTPEVTMKSLHISSCLPHPTWMVKRSVYEALGGYRPIHRCEDYDFLLRCLKAGYRLGLCDDFLLHYRIVSSSISHSALLRQWLSAKHLSKNYPRLEEVDMDEIQRQVYDKVSEKDCENFRKADMLFIEALSHRRRHPLKTVWLLLRSATTSRYYIGKFTDMLRLRIIRKAN